MKKSLYITFFAVLLCFLSIRVFALTNFSQALLTCENYSKEGSIKHQNEVFNLLITLDKAKNGKCVYREKIYQDKDYQMLTCNFEKSELEFLSKSMEEFNKTFRSQIAKNNIFEAKMTTNGEIFQKYLIDPQYCKITHSKKK